MRNINKKLITKIKFCDFGDEESGCINQKRVCRPSLGFLRSAMKPNLARQKVLSRLLGRLCQLYRAVFASLPVYSMYPFSLSQGEGTPSQSYRSTCCRSSSVAQFFHGANDRSSFCRLFF